MLCILTLLFLFRPLCIRQHIRRRPIDSSLHPPPQHITVLKLGVAVIFHLLYMHTSREMRICGWLGEWMTFPNRGSHNSFSFFIFLRDRVLFTSVERGVWVSSSFLRIHKKSQPLFYGIIKGGAFSISGPCGDETD